MCHYCIRLDTNISKSSALIFFFFSFDFILAFAQFIQTMHLELISLIVEVQGVRCSKY